MTKLQEISPEFIEKLFKRWAISDFSEAEMNTLLPLVSDNFDNEKRRLQVRDWLYQQIIRHLPVNQSNGEALDHTTIRKILEKKWQQKDEVEIFALIYCRYLAMHQYQTQELAELTGFSTKTVRRYIKKGFQKISIELKMELSQHERDRAPAGYTSATSADRVVGIEPLLGRIRSWLDTKNPPRAISIEGLGGIGKTLIAQHLFEERYQAKCHDEYVWVSARQESISFDAEIHPSENFVSNLDDIVARLAHNLGQSHLAGLSTQEKINGLQKLSQRRKLLIAIEISKPHWMSKILSPLCFK